MKSVFLSAAAAVCVLLCTSCGNKVNINADYRPITYVFGLLDQNESTHYVRINRAFLGEGNALVFAQNYDSLYFPPEQLNVKVEVYNSNGNLVNTIALRDTYEIAKKPGIFHHPEQQIWYFNAALNANNTYKLIVHDLKNDVITTGQTQLLRGFALQSPQTSTQTFGFLPLGQTFPYRWNTAANGKLYELIIEINYTERKLPNGETLTKKLIWNLGRDRSQGVLGGETMNISVPHLDFYRFLNVNLEKSLPTGNQYERSFINMNLRINGASEDFTTFLDLSAPSDGLVQERPYFSNISNGFGLFASRFQFQKTMNISNATQDTVRSNVFTKDLGF